MTGEKKIRHMIKKAGMFFLIFGLLFSHPVIGLAIPNDDIYQELCSRYPEEINTLKKYGATETKIRNFIEAFEGILEKNQELTEENFEKEAADALISLYLSFDHISVFDGVFNGWNLNPDQLLNAYNQGGTEEVMNLLPESFREIGVLVKERIFPTGDINKDGRIDLFDFIYFSKHIGVIEGEEKFSRLLDMNRDGKIDEEDLHKVSMKYGRL